MSSELEATVTEESRAQWLKNNEQFQKDTAGINENEQESSNDIEEGNPLVDITDDDEAIELVDE